MSVSVDTLSTGTHVITLKAVDTDGQSSTTSINVTISKDSRPKITGVAITGKKLILSGENFDTEAVILLEGQPQKTRSDTSGTNIRLIAKKGGKLIKPGQAVTLQVKNQDGTFSDEFLFMRLP